MYEEEKAIKTAVFQMGIPKGYMVRKKHIDTH